ncbi:MAG: hypothetical protein ACLPTJ_21705 [Solirubrobacteraceae bacterium]
MASASAGIEMEVLRCTHCGERIGVFEPAWVILEDGTELRGSCLTLSSELELPGSIAVHEHCHGEFVVGRRPG